MTIRLLKNEFKTVTLTKRRCKGFEACYVNRLTEFAIILF